MQIEKKAINYYKSFFDVSKELTQKQFYEFNMAVFEVMFFEKHIDSISFNDQMLSILWKSIKHSIDASVKGYCDKKSTPYDDMFNPLINPLINPLSNPLANKNNEKEKEKEKGELESQIIITDNLPIDYKFIQDFIDNRKKLKKPMTKKAIELFIGNVIKYHNDGYDVILLIEKAIMNGWQSLYPKPEDKTKGTSSAFGDKVGNNMHVFDNFMKRREEERNAQ